MGKRAQTHPPTSVSIHPSILPVSVTALSLSLSPSVAPSYTHLPQHLSQLFVLSVPCRTVVEPSLPDESEFLYATQPALLRYRSAWLAVAEVMDWYRNRAEEIEHYARQVRLQCCIGCSALSEWAGCKLQSQGSCVQFARGEMGISQYLYSFILCLRNFCGSFFFLIPKEQIHTRKVVQKSFFIKYKMQSMYILLQIFHVCLIGFIAF